VQVEAMTSPEELNRLAAAIDQRLHDGASPARTAIIAEVISSITSAGWRDIETHDGSMTHVEGWNEKFGAHETWFFAPSSITRDWWIVGVPRRKWKPTHFRPLPSPPALGRRG
jgi:hypothetical protein